MDSFIGLFRATVVNTNSFIDTGFISVHISGVSVSQDDFYNCMIRTTFGGLDKNGMFTVPPIGSTGYVLFVRNEPSESPLWMGSPMVPSDLNTEKQDNEKLFVPPETVDPTTIVLRSQYTKKETGGEDLTSDKNKIESIIRLNENEITFSKPKTNDYTYKKNPYNLLSEKQNTIMITDTEIYIKYISSDNKKFILKLGDNGIELNYNDKNKITMIGDNILLNSDNKSKIELKGDGVVKITTSEYIKILGEDDHLLKWSKYNELVTAFNMHTHEPGSDAPSSGPPLPNLSRPSLIGTSLSSPPSIQVGRVKYSSNKAMFGVAPTASTAGFEGLLNAIGGLFGTSYRDAKAAKSEKNKL